MKDIPELKDAEKAHIEKKIDEVRRMVRDCSEERMPQGACRFCLEVYRATINQAIDLGLYE